MTPPTFPGRPRNGGPLELALKAGMYGSRFDCALNRVCFQPKYNGWRAMVHTPSGRMFNRYNHEFSGVQRSFVKALEQLKECPFEWLDCEALERRHDIGVGSLIVLDWVTSGMGQQDRHTFLSCYFPDATVGKEYDWEAGCYLVTEHPREYEGVLKARNAALGCVFYEGVITKQIKSEYPMQLESANETATAWVKHKFTTL